MQDKSSHFNQIRPCQPVVWYSGIPDPLTCKELIDRLGPRQLEILELASMGWPTKLIARRTGISLKTVHNHLNVVYIKLKTTSLHGALAVLRRAGEVEEKISEEDSWTSCKVG